MPANPTILYGNPDAYDTNAGADYRGYRIDTVYEYDPGVFILPVASLSPKVVAVRVHGGYGKRTVNFDTTKNNKPPIIPAAVDTDSDILVSAHVNVGLPAPNPNGGFDWRVSGIYEYVTADRLYGPRIPGVHMLPSGNYPHPLPVQDAIAEGMFQYGTSATFDDFAKATLGGNAIQEDSYLWPFTVFPPQFCNPLLLREQ